VWLDVGGGGVIASRPCEAKCVVLVFFLYVVYLLCYIPTGALALVIEAFGG